MVKRPTRPDPQPAKLDAASIKAAIARMQRRLTEIQSFDAMNMASRADPEFSGLNTRLAESLAQTYPPDTHEYARHKNHLRIWDGPHYAGYETPKAEWAPAINESRIKVAGVVSAIISSLQEQLADVEAASPAVNVKHSASREVPSVRRVFVVHGHDSLSKAEVARTIQKLGLQEVILHEQPNKGATLIEKLERNSDCDFAVVLLTPDDEGRARGESELRNRARQNVIVELGFFVGKLGRENVCALYVPGVEIPSDFQGVAWHELDPTGAWKFQLGKELRAAGFDVDLNRL